MSDSPNLDNGEKLHPGSQIPTPDPTCGNCALWARIPADPTNLGAPPQGQCRERVHLLVIPVATVRGVVPEVRPVYPVLPAGFPVCSHFVPR